VIASDLSGRRLTLDDAAAGARLSDLAGWSGTVEDWRARIAHTGGFGLYDLKGLLVAAGLVFAFAPRMGFIGNILVDPDWRGRGLGRLMTQRCMAMLQAMRLPIYLIATQLGLPIYLKLGFTEIDKLVHLRQRAGEGRRSGPSNGAVRPMMRDDIDAVLDLDARVYGGDRAIMLQPHLSEQPIRGVVAIAAGRVAGYACVANRRTYGGIGPLVAKDTAVALALVRALAPQMPGLIGCDVPAYQTDFIAALKSEGYRRAEAVPFMGYQTDRAWPFARPAELFAGAARAAC